MSGTQITSHGLSARKKKILFRAWHRGMREMDLLFGQFADANIADLFDDQLDTFETLLDLPDRDVLAWLTGEKSAPIEHQTEFLAMIISFHANKALL